MVVVFMKFNLNVHVVFLPGSIEVKILPGFLAFFSMGKTFFSTGTEC